MYKFLVLVVLLIDSDAVPVFDEDVSYPVVDTPVGTIRGLRAEDGNYSMFMGIPYAQVDPDNPFGNSKPYPNFESTFDAFDDSAICPQVEEFNHTIVGSLDCLHVNVYVPDSASDVNLLPVFVWIFGGGFNLGFPGRFLYGPRFLVRHDIIFVTLNYRLGPYGFMCLDIPEVPGNQGLKDQILALRWIKDNIEAFGGDSSKISIGGNSAGAVSVDMHLHYGQDDLYHRIIPQSGTVSLASTIVDPNPNSPFELASILNHNSSDVNDALTFLAKVDPHELIAAAQEMTMLSFSPCIEHEFENVERFITEHPLSMLVPRVKDVDILIGLNNDEAYGGYANMPDILFSLVDFVQLMINMHFDFEGEDDLYAEMHKVVTNFYFGDEDITSQYRQQVADLTSDFFFNHPILRSVKKYLDNGVQNLYLYKFSYSGERNFVKHRENISGGGAVHADELGYLFDISYMKDLLNPEDQLIVDRMTELWANFVKYGNPTPEPTALVPVSWQPATQDKWYYLELDSTLRLSSRPFHDRMAFLDLFYKTNEGYQRDYQESTGSNVVLNLSIPSMLLLVYFLK